MSRSTAALLGVLIALISVAGAARAQAPQNLVVQASTEPPGLDLTATPASATAGVVLYNIQECLVKVDRTGKIAPWLAERWNTTDNRNYTFFLRRGVRFHNGRELKAADVKFVFERAMNPETKHPYPRYYEAIGDIIVNDDYTITFSLKTLNANFLLNLARQGSVIYPREAVETLKSAPIGTGPFRFEEWVRGDRIVLVKNPEYHGKGLPRLDRVTFRFITDPNAVLAALKAGDVDASLFGLGAEHVQELSRDARFAIVVGDTTNDVILAMNNARKPFSDVRVRRAVTHAIDKQDVLKGAMFGMGKILGTNVDPLNPYYVDMTGATPHDSARARKLLAEAGYPNGFEAGEVVPIPPFFVVAEAVVNDLNAVGIRVKLRPIERAAFYAAWREKKLRGLFLTAVGASGNAATRVEAFIYSKGAYAYGGYPDLDALYQEQAVERDRAKRAALLHRIQSLTVERVMFAPVMDARWLTGVGARVAEHTINAIPLHPFPSLEDVRLKEQ
jgi:peptide/nickel transport system substrate-binding protein